MSDKKLSWWTRSGLIAGASSARRALDETGTNTVAFDYEHYGITLVACRSDRAAALMEAWEQVFTRLPGDPVVRTFDKQCAEAGCSMRLYWNQDGGTTRDPSLRSDFCPEHS